MPLLRALANGSRSAVPLVPKAERRQSLRWAGAAVLAGSLGLPLSACRAPQPPLRVGSIVFPGYELLFLAREMGLLDEHLLRLVELRSNTEILRALATGQLEAAALTLDELLTARADGVDLRVALVLDQSAGVDVLMVRPGVDQLSALKGLRIGVEDSATGAVMLGAVLDAARLRIDQVHKVSMTLGRSVDVYLSGAVDAVISAEPWATRLEQQGALRLFDSSAIPGRIIDVLAAKGAVFEQNGQALRRLIDAHFAALAFFRSESAQAFPLLAPRLQLPPDQVHSAFRGMLFPDLLENRRLLSAGGLVQQAGRGLMTVMLQQGLLAKPLDLQSLVDLRGLPAS